MVTIMPAAPLNGPAILPAALIDQYVKPSDEQAALVDAFRLTALHWVERHTLRSLQRRTWVAMFDGFDEIIRLPCDPVRSVVALGYVDQGGHVVDGTDMCRLAGAQLLPRAGTRWPATARQPGAVTVSFEAGYDDAALEAPALRIAALLLMRHLFDGGSPDDAPLSVTMLLDEQYRTPVIG